MNTAWFVDGAFLFKCWSSLGRADNLDYMLLREYLEDNYCDKAGGERINESYYFNSDPDPPTAQQNAFHNFLTLAPPRGPGFRVKLYWLQRTELHWPNRMGGGPVVHPASGESFVTTQQKGVDVGLAFHLMKAHARKNLNRLFLGAGDGDFHEVVQHLVENEGVSLILIGNDRSISSDLRPYAEEVVELDKIAGSIARAKTTRT